MRFQTKFYFNLALSTDYMSPSKIDLKRLGEIKLCLRTSIYSVIIKVTELVCSRYTAKIAA